MERRHVDRLREKSAQELLGKKLVILRISDNYHLQDPALIALLRQKLGEHLGPALFS